MSRFLGKTRTGARIGAVMLVLAAGIFAQPNPAGDAPQGEAVLFMMVRTAPNLSEQEILGTLKRGLQVSKCQIDGEPRIQPIQLTIYAEFENLINRTSALPVNLDAEGPLQPRLVPSRELLWEFRLKEATDILKKLTVKYKKAGSKEYEPKDPRTDPRAPLTLTALGRYALRPEPDDEPTSFEAQVASLGKKDEVVKGTWPENDRCFVITMNNFRGNRKQLFADIQDAEKVPNPLKQVRLRPDLMFVFANLGVDSPERRPFIDGSEFVIQDFSIQGRKVERVWVLFPLGPDNYEKMLAEYRKLDSDGLSKAIRKYPAPGDLEIGSKSEARWFEMKRKSGFFEARISLKELTELEKKYSRLWYLLVWEFHEPGTDPGAIAIMHPRTKDRVFVLEEEWLPWSLELATAIKRQAGKGK